MADEYEVFVQSSLRGYHAYVEDVTVCVNCVGEVMKCEIEENDVHDKHAVAVEKECG